MIPCRITLVFVILLNLGVSQTVFCSESDVESDDSSQKLGSFVEDVESLIDVYSYAYASEEFSASILDLFNKSLVGFKEIKSGHYILSKPSERFANILLMTELWRILEYKIFDEILDFRLDCERELKNDLYKKIRNETRSIVLGKKWLELRETFSSNIDIEVFRLVRKIATEISEDTYDLPRFFSKMLEGEPFEDLHNISAYLVNQELKPVIELGFMFFILQSYFVRYCPAYLETIAELAELISQKVSNEKLDDILSKTKLQGESALVNSFLDSF